MVHHGVFRRVVARGQQAFGQGHAHGRGQPLAQRAGGHLHAHIQVIFRVPRSLGTPLTKIFNLFQRQVIAGQMQQAVEQHGGVPVGKHKTVPVGPAGIGGIMPKHVPPESLGHVGHAQRRAGVPGTGFFNGVHGQDTESIGALSAGGHETVPSLLFFEDGERRPSCRSPAAVLGTDYL